MALLRMKYSQAPPADPGTITREDFEAYEKEKAEAKARAEQRRNNPSHLDLLAMFRRKWGLSWYPQEIFNLRCDHEEPNNAQDYEQGLRKYIERVKASREPFELPTKLAVTAEDPYIAGEWYEYEDEYGDLPPDAPIPGASLVIRVNLSYPQDVLESLIRKELRRALASRKRILDRSSHKKRRLRTSKIEFELDVFDRCEAGQSFEQIAKDLNVKSKTIKGRRSTVRSVYLAVCRKIQEETGQPFPADVGHACDTCPICSKADFTSQFCRIGQNQLRLT